MNAPDLKPDWLKELQQKSWEPEILLSGIVLYGMFQVPPSLDRFLFFFSNEIYSDINAMDLLVALLKMGVYWLIVGLVLHLICRGLWIGLVGLSYSFPKGIDLKKLKFQPKYLAKVQAVPPFDEIILKLERICSFIYSVSFLLFMSLVGTYIYLTVLVVIPMVFVVFTIDSIATDENLINLLNSYGSAVIIFGLIGVIDFLTMGYFRRFKLVAKIYWPFYQMFNLLTLANYYRPTYFAIVTNLNKRWLFSFLLMFVLISFIGVSATQNSTPGAFFSRIDIWSDRGGDKAFEGYYQDRQSDSPSVQVQIPSDIIRDDVLRVFIPSRISFQDSLKKFMKYDSISTIADESFNEGQYYLEQIGEFYSLTIGDSTFRTKRYFQNATSTNQKGHITYLNIGYLEEGLYELKLEGPSEMYSSPFAIVPFYKMN